MLKMNSALHHYKCSKGLKVV